MIKINTTGIKQNQTFELADVAVNWDSNSNGEKIQMGKQFKEEVALNLQPTVEFIKINSKNHAIYKVVK